jgi:prevent-host-death family protein
MTSVTALEAKTRFGQLLKRVAQGEEVVITRHEQPVARLVPEGPARLESVREAVARLRSIRRKITVRNQGKAALGYDALKAAIEEGRR